MNIIELSLNCHLKKNSSQMCSNPFTQSITPMITHMSAQVLRVSFHPARPPATHYTRLAIRRMEASPRKLAPPVPKEAKAKMTMFMTSEATRASLCITMHHCFVRCNRFPGGCAKVPRSPRPSSPPKPNQIWADVLTKHILLFG